MMDSLAVAYAGRRGGGGRVTTKGYKVSFLDNSNVLKLDYGDGSTTRSIY